jgi:hypothetical protein
MLVSFIVKFIVILAQLKQAQRCIRASYGNQQEVQRNEKVR